MPKIAVRRREELVPLNMRVPRSLRDRLEDAAADSGRSLTAEVNYRVERAFDLERMFDGEFDEAFQQRMEQIVDRVLANRLRVDLAHFRAALLSELRQPTQHKRDTRANS